MKIKLNSYSIMGLVVIASTMTLVCETKPIDSERDCDKKEITKPSRDANLSMTTTPSGLNTRVGEERKTALASQTERNVTTESTGSTKSKVVEDNLSKKQSHESVKEVVESAESHEVVLSHHQPLDNRAETYSELPDGDAMPPLAPAGRHETKSAHPRYHESPQPRNVVLHLPLGVTAYLEPPIQKYGSLEDSTPVQPSSEGPVVNVQVGEGPVQEEVASLLPDQSGSDMPHYRSPYARSHQDSHYRSMPQQEDNGQEIKEQHDDMSNRKPHDDISNQKQQQDDVSYQSEQQSIDAKNLLDQVPGLASLKLVSQSAGWPATILTEVPQKDMPPYVLDKLKREYGIKVIATRDGPDQPLKINCEEVASDSQTPCDPASQQRLAAHMQASLSGGVQKQSSYVQQQQHPLMQYQQQEQSDNVLKEYGAGGDKYQEQQQVYPVVPHAEEQHDVERKMKQYDYGPSSYENNYRTIHHTSPESDNASYENDHEEHYNSPHSTNQGGEYYQ